LNEDITLRSLSTDWFVNLSIHSEFVNRDKAVDIANGYGPDDSGVRVSVAVGKEFSIFLVVQTDSGAYPAFYPMCTRVSFSGGKEAG
jgi:hypothetical protein